jgi:phage-related protein
MALSKKLTVANTNLNTQKAALSRLTPGTAAYAAQLLKVKDAQGKVSAIMAGLGPVQRKFLDNTEKLKGAWQGFVTQTSGATLGPLNTVMTVIIKHMGDLVPLVKDVGVLAQGVADKFKKWADTGGLSRFIKILRTDGVSGLYMFTKIAQNLLSVLGTGFRAFLPLGHGVTRTLLQGSQALKGWADGGGFARFLAKVQKSAPAVKEFFTSLVAATANLSRAIANLGPLSLLTATGLLKLVAAAPPWLLSAIVAGFVAWRVAEAGALVVTQAMTIWQARQRILWVATVIVMRTARAAILAWAAAQWILNVALTANPIGLIVLAIAGLVTIIVLIATKTTWFQTAWRVAWGAIKVAFTAVWGFISHGLGQLVLLLLGPVGALAILALNWRTVWNGIKAVGTAVWGAMGTAFRATFNGLKAFASASWNATASVFRGVWNGVKAFGSASWHATSTVFHSVWNGLKAFGSASWHATASVFRSVWNGVKAFGSASWHAAVSVFKASQNGLKAYGSASWHATASVFRGVWNGVKAFGSASWRSTLSVFKSVFNAMKAYGSASWHALASVARSVFTGVKNTLAGIWRGILSAAKSSWNQLKGVVSAPVKFVVNNVIGNLAKAFNSIAKAVHIGIRIPVPHFADGGHVRGPGTGRSDSVPAMLSNGEYVIPAHVVKRHGVGYFDRIRGGHDPMATESQRFNGGGEQGVKGYGIGGWIPDPIKKIGKAALNALVPGASSVMDTFGSWTKKFISGTLLKGVNSLVGKIPGGGIMHETAKAGVKTLIKGATDLLFKQNEENGGGGPIGGKVPKGAQLALLKKALSITHTPPPGSLGQWLAGLNTLITRESGWNAGARNGWDSNAKAGMASVGLMQTIPPTFNAYKMAGHGNIRNGLDNVIAGIRYIKARYGNITKVQQANANAAPKGYAGGGMVKMVANSFDKGGYLPKGYSVAFNGTGRPEPVGHNLTAGGAAVTVKFEGCTFAGGQQDFENMVVKAVSEAKRKRRI